MSTDSGSPTDHQETSTSTLPAHPSRERAALYVEVTPEVRHLARRLAAHLDLKMPAAMTLLIEQAAQSYGLTSR